VTLKEQARPKDEDGNERDGQRDMDDSMLLVYRLRTLCGHDNEACEEGGRECETDEETRRQEKMT
jgi:hypothetical protein